MKIAIMRHGLTDYKQNYPVSVGEADDLKPEGIGRIQLSAQKINNYLGFQPDIISSPYGRAIHTAKVVADVLEVSHNKISLNSELEEVRNFEFELLRVLTEGGIYHFNDEEVMIDSRVTNPNNLPHTTYFNSDLSRHMSVSAKRSLPRELIDKIEGMEICTEACQRLENVIKTMNRNSLVVTHQGLTQRLLEQMGYSHDEYIDRGEFIVVDALNGDINPFFWSEKD